MSIKIVHLIFIAFCMALALFVGAWGIGEYRNSGEVSGLVLALVFLVVGAGLAVYAPRFWAKVKEFDS